MTFDPTKIELSSTRLNTPLQRHISGVAIHGNTPFDCPVISPIRNNLFIGGCEDGLKLPSGIQHVISLYPWEEYRNAFKCKSYLRVKMYDSLTQAFAQVDAIARWVATCLEDGPTLVHCQAGLNRSSLVGARALMLSEGLSAARAIALIRERRTQACLCNTSFEEWLREFDKNVIVG